KGGIERVTGAWSGRQSAEAAEGEARSERADRSVRRVGPLPRGRGSEPRGSGLELDRASGYAGHGRSTQPCANIVADRENAVTEPRPRGSGSAATPVRNGTPYLALADSPPRASSLVRGLPAHRRPSLALSRDGCCAHSNDPVSG